MKFLRKIHRIFKSPPSFPLESVIYEVTPACNLACLQCYNVWKDGVDYSRQQLSTAQAKALIRKAVQETGCSDFTFSGGEPCCREDLEELVRTAVDLDCQVALITNGTLLTRQRIESLVQAGVAMFELPLNSSVAKTHDQMAGKAGSFDKVVQAAAELAELEQDVAFVFVSTRINRGHFKDALDLGIALGARSFLYNRYNGGGQYHRQPEKLMPSLETLHEDLAYAQNMCSEYGLAIGASIAMPPCLIDTKAFPNVGFGFCAAGTSTAYYTLDPLGNLRPCNHTPTILGNLFDSTFAKMAASTKMNEFTKARPQLCSGCQLEDQCLGSCKAAAEVCYGDITHPEPFLHLNRNQIKPLK